jgi:ferredoxin-NADP reductase
MQKQIVRILDSKFLTHDVKCFRIEKPAGFSFIPGQAIDISINKPGWTEKKNPFSMTSLPGDKYVEFIIKTYPNRKGFTDELLRLNKNDELILYDVFGTINYQGKGTFIAGGAGITPFISIFRDLKSKDEIQGNMLIFGNKTSADIILKKELEILFGDNIINILSHEKEQGYEFGMINEDFLEEHVPDLRKKFYLCGPPPMIKLVLKALYNLGVPESSIIKEEF